MDLIRRDKAVVQLSHNKTGNDDSDVVIQHDIETVKGVPSAFDGMTNWEVLKTIFPYAEIVGGDGTLTAIRIDSNPKTGTPIAMYTEWLNAPYSTIPKVGNE